MLEPKTIANKTAAYTVVAGDLGKIINCTANTFTISLTAAATLGAGFVCTIWNTSNTYTDVITIDPNLAETIDSIATLTLQRGEGLDIVCDGTGWQVDNKKPMRMYAENLSVYWARPVCSGNGAIAIGEASSSSGLESYAFGYGANASGQEALAIGTRANAASNFSTAIGENSTQQGSTTITGSGAMALGGSYASGADSFAAAIANNTSSYGALGANSIAFGQNAKAASASSLAAGSNAQATGTNAIAIGTSATSSSNSSVSVGVTASTMGLGALAIGYQANANGNYDYANAIGFNSYVRGYSAVAIGNSYASGTDSFAAAIANNTSSYGAQGANAIAMGYQNRANSQGAIAIGHSNTITAMGGYPFGLIIGFGNVARSNCVVLGTYNNIPIGAGDDCIAIGSGHTNNTHQTFNFGISNTATGLYATTMGAGAASLQKGKYSYANNGFATVGDAQYGKIILKAATTTSTAVVLTSDRAAASTNNQLIVASDQAMTFFGTLIAKQSASANMASYLIKGSIVNNAGTVSISSIAIETIVDTIGLTTQPTFTADNTNKALTVTSGAKATTNIRWVCNLDSVEVTYA